MGDREEFLSVENCKALISRCCANVPTDLRMAVPERRLVYRVMTDVMDLYGDGSTVAEMNDAAAALLGDFYRRSAEEMADAGNAAEGGGREGSVDIGDPYRDYKRAADEANEAGDACSAIDPLSAMARAAVGKPGDSTLEEALARAGISDAPFSDPLLKPPPPKRVVERFVLVNGADRNWDTNPYRFMFKADLSRSGSQLASIRSIRATRLIVPREIVEERTHTNIPKKHFVHAFGLPFPFLIMRLDEVPSVCVSTNPESSRAFAHFVFKSVYQSPNGRDYIMMESVQGEYTAFPSSPLSSLPSMTLSVRQPNGSLLNDSQDNYELSSLFRDQNVNKQWIRVQLERFFDKNEFFVNDVVRLTEEAFRPDVPAVFSDFLTRAKGHEVMEMGAPNESGYYNSFYVRAPGEFKPSDGTYAVSDSAVEDLMTFDRSDRQVRIINTSLQISAAFVVSVEEDDVKF